MRVVEACLHKEQVSPYFPPSHWITTSKNSATLLQTTVDVVNHSTHYNARTSVMHPRLWIERTIASVAVFFFWCALQRNVPTQKAEKSFNPKTVISVVFLPNKYWDVWKLNFNWTQCYLPSLPCVFLLISFFQWDHKKKDETNPRNPPSCSLAIPMSHFLFRWEAEHLFKGLLKKNKKWGGVIFPSLFLFHSVFPFRFVEGLCPLTIVWSSGSLKERGKIS